MGEKWLDSSALVRWVRRFGGKLLQGRRSDGNVGAKKKQSVFDGLKFEKKIPLKEQMEGAIRLVDAVQKRGAITEEYAEEWKREISKSFQGD